MENYKNIRINSEIDDVERVERGLYGYLRDRVWGDAHLLDGFSETEISDIIVKTMDKFGDEINKFVGVALEKIANEKLEKTDKLETLRKFVVFEGETYTPSIYITAWGHWAIKYEEITSHKNILCGVVIEEKNAPTEINDTYDRIGNARSMDEAVVLVNRYLNNVLRIK